MSSRFAFFESYYDSLKELPAKAFKEALCAVCEKAFKGNDIEVTGMAKTVYGLMMPTVEKSVQLSKERAKSGKKGGEANRKQTESKTEANEKQTDNTFEAKVEQNVSKTGGEAEVAEKLQRRKTQKSAVMESELSDPVKEKLIEWLQYKTERREGYKETGLKSLITEAKRHENESGSTAVINLITECMANGWRGIIWNKLEKPRERPKTYAERVDSRYDVADDWLKERGNNDVWGV